MERESREVHLRDYYRVILKRRWTVVSILVILVSTVTIVTFSMEPVYRASSQIRIERDNPNVVSIQEVLAVDAASTDYYQTQYEILKSDNLARRVVNRIRLDTHPEFSGTSRWSWKNFFNKSTESREPKPAVLVREKQLIQAFQNRLKVTPIRNSRLVNVSFESRDPGLSALAANTLTEEYIRYSIETKIEASREARTWLNLQVDDMREKVRGSEEAFEDYKQTIPKRIMARIESSSSIVEMENRPEVVNNPFIQELRVEEIKISAKLAELSEKYGPKHPQMIQLNSQLNTLRDRMNREVKRVVAAVLIEESPDYLLLKREAEANRNIYEVLLARLKETTVTENLPQSNIFVLDKALIPDFPVKPRKGTNILLSILLGVISGVSLAFFFEYLDNTVKGPEDIERYLRVPFLGAVPAAKKLTPEKPVELMTAHSPQSPQAESYRTIRTSLLLAMAERQPKLILITSPAPVEGKTTTASNLAIAMAQSGNSVLLMDGDLRKPSLHRLFGQDNAKGLSSVLVGQGTLEANIHQTFIPLLSLLATGPLPPNPSELLGSKRMKELMSVAVERFDRVVIDSAPTMPVADSILLATMCDGVVMVIKESETKREMALTACKRLTDSGSKILGAVLNNVDMRQKGYYFYPYYRYYYSEDGKAKGSRSTA